MENSEHKTAEQFLYDTLVTDPEGIYDHVGYTDYMSHGWKDQYLKAMELYSAQQVAITIENLKRLARSFYGQGRVGYDFNSHTSWEAAWKDYVETGALCDWGRHRSDWKEKLPIDELIGSCAQQVADQREADRLHIEELKAIEIYLHKEIDKLKAEAQNQINKNFRLEQEVEELKLSNETAINSIQGIVEPFTEQYGFALDVMRITEAVLNVKSDKA